MFWCRIRGSWGMCGFWSTHHLNYACGRVGQNESGGVVQNESGGVKQCTGRFYLHVIREPMVTIIFIFPLEQGKEK